MSLHVPVVPELFLTNITEEGLLAGVGPLVGLQVAQLGEGLVAGLAFEGLQHGRDVWSRIKLLFYISVELKQYLLTIIKSLAYDLI